MYHYLPDIINLSHLPNCQFCNSPKSQKISLLKDHLTFWTILGRWFSLQWCHNGGDGIPNHRCLNYLLNLLFRRISKKTSKLCVTGLCEGNPPVPVTWKKFPLDVIMGSTVAGMVSLLSCSAICLTITCLPIAKYNHTPHTMMDVIHMPISVKPQ